MNPTQTSSLPARITAPRSVANIVLRHRQLLPGWGERAAQAATDRDGKFHLTAIVRAGARLRGRARGPFPVSVEGCPWGSATLYQTVVCTLSFCSELPPSPHRCREGTGVQAGYRQDRRHSVVLPVIQLQSVTITVHWCKRGTERAR